jgi:nucleoside-diphosphate-sugar epimerase
MIMEPKELHVVFGTGPLGMATARALLGRGHQVRMVSRSGKADLLGVEVRAADAYDARAVQAVSAGAAAVYQCAQPAYHEWVTKFPPLQSSIIEGAAAAGAKLVVAENLYMYGEVRGPMTEATAVKPHTRKGTVRAQMAEQVQAAHRSGKLRTTSGRGSDFYGPAVRESALGERVFAAALAGKAASGAGNLDLPHTFTYINDFGEALAVLGERDEALGRAWHVPNAATLSQRQVLTMVFEELGMPAKLSSVSRLMLRIAGLFIVGARESVEMMYEFEQPFVVDSSAYIQAFGDHATPYRTALQSTIAWYRAHASQQAHAAA